MPCRPLRGNVSFYSNISVNDTDLNCYLESLSIVDAWSANYFYYNGEFFSLSTLLLAISYYFPPCIAGGYFGKAKEKPRLNSRGFVFALPIFPGSRPPSIVSVHELNFCVRDGNRWTLMTINTNYICKSFRLYILFGDPWENRTPVTGVRGRCLNRLTNGPLVHLHGLEPGTH